MQFQIHFQPNVANICNACMYCKKGPINDNRTDLYVWGGTEQNRNSEKRSIKPEPWKTLLGLALEMFMFQPQYVNQPPTHNVLVWVPFECVVLCQSVDGKSLFSQKGWFHIHIFLQADLMEEQLNWG